MEKPVNSIIIKDPNVVTVAVAKWLNTFMQENPAFFESFMSVAREFSTRENSVANLIEPLAKKFQAHGEFTTEEFLTFCWILKDAWELQTKVLAQFGGDQKKADKFAKDAVKQIRKDIKGEKDILGKGFKKSSYPNI